MSRYWNDFLCHSQAYTGSGSGRTKKNHKYVYKIKKAGKWVYYYPEDIAAMKKAKNEMNFIAKNVEYLNNKSKKLGSTVDPNAKANYVNRRLNEYATSLKKQGVSDHVISHITDTIKSESGYSTTTGQTAKEKASNVDRYLNNRLDGVREANAARKKDAATKAKNSKKRNTKNLLWSLQ